MKQLLEKDIEKDVTTFIENQGYVVYPQIRLLNRRIDLLGIRADNQMLAVELKIRNWKQAIHQAYLGSLCASKAFVALPSTTLHLVDLNIFIRTGIGLLSVNGNVDVIVRARTLGNIHPTLQRKVFESATASRMKGGIGVARTTDIL